MKQVWALAAKDLKLLLRDKVGFFFTFFFPVLYATFFGSIYGGMGTPRKMQIAIVDEDQTDESRRFRETLAQGAELALTDSSREEAARQVRLGNVTAYIVLPKGFGEARSQFFGGPGVTLETGVNPSRRAEAGLLEGVLMRRLFEGFSDLFTRPEVAREQVRRSLAQLETADDLDPVWRLTLTTFLGSLENFVEAIPEEGAGGEGANGGWQPFRIQNTSITREGERPKSSYEVSFPQAILWGVMGCSAAFGISLVVERSRGTLVRLQMAPLNRFSILAGKAVACLTTTISVTVALLLLGVVVFGVRPDSVPLLALAILSVAVAFVGLMMLFSVLGRTEQAAGGIGWAILTVMAMLGGGMVPLFAMPEFMQNLSHVSPIKWAILALEGAIWRNYSLLEMLWPCGILVAVGVVAFAVGTRLFRWSVA